ncbi:MAG: hypothetical protein JXD18_13060 [Anaerolineae bacterium]|nr:hypothetical protein [Anaerolineae bacterium]
MSKRVLAIGVGGSGKTALTILKERLEETYGRVPDNIVLLSLDTDDLREEDSFAGTKLNALLDERRREPEFRHVVSRPGVTMDTIFGDIASENVAPYMTWLEKDKLERILGPSERDIRGGAQQRRPVGRVAVFQRWKDPILSAITDGIARIYGEPEDQPRQLDDVRKEQSKRLVFIVGSVAGGTGSGFLIDVANLVRHAVQTNRTRWQSVDVSAIVVLPDAFSTYVNDMKDSSNLKPNSYAALREMDRFIRTHGAHLPYMIRYDEDIRSITWSTNQPLDHVYLVDTASPSAVGEFDLSGDPKTGVFPVIADFIMAHVDENMGDSMATLRANAGQHYNKEEGWMYSSFNVLTYLFPVDDVIESFSYRFLREMMARQFLPLTNRKTRSSVEDGALKEVERIFAESSIGGKVNPGVTQKAIAVTRKMTPDSIDPSWPGLFNLIALSETAFAEDYKDLDEWLAYIHDNLTPTKEGDYKHETYDEGYERLLDFGETAMDDCLGKQLDPDDEESREDGQWDRILARYRGALRQRFSEALDAALLSALNRRDPNSKMLAAARLPFAQAMVASLKAKLVEFKADLDKEYRTIRIDDRLRQINEQLRDTITWMYDTKDTKTRAILGKPEARKAQDAYIGLFYDKMQLSLHQRVYRVVLDVLNALGADEKDQDGQPSVLDQAALELENWQATLQEVDKILAHWERVHKQHREEKRQIRVRRYVTDDAFEDQLYRLPQHSGMVGSHVLGQVRGETGMVWQRKEEEDPLYYKLSTMWAQEALGPEEIARKFFAGAKDLFQIVRENVTIAERLASHSSPTGLVNYAKQVDQPFLRYNPASNGQKVLNHERYVSFNLSKANDEGREFLEEVYNTLRHQGFNVNTAAESLVACTVVEVARGVRLSAVDQFRGCEADYRRKLYEGREGLHLFPEEQVATGYEGRIESLGEPKNRLRPLAPEVVIAMGDEAKLKAFTLACAYGLIDRGRYTDKDGRESVEIFLTLNGRQMPLSQSTQVQELDPRFRTVAAEEQMARLYLNALQNFVLKATEKPGVPSEMVTTIVEDLARQGVSLGYIETPLTLSLLEVNGAINRFAEGLGPSPSEVPDRKKREADNSRRRVEQYLQPFLMEWVTGQAKDLDGNSRSGFKGSPARRVIDMGTVMHLILQEEIALLLNQASSR